METPAIPKENDLSSEDQRILESLKIANQIMPNLHATLGYPERNLNHPIAFQNRGTALSAKEKEAVYLIVSELDGCKPCISEHTLTAIMHGFSEIEVSNVRKGYSSDIKLDTMIALAKEISKNTGHISKDAIYDFFDAGYTRDNLVDLILLVTEKSNSN